MEHVLSTPTRARAAHCSGVAVDGNTAFGQIICFRACSHWIPRHATKRWYVGEANQRSPLFPTSFNIQLAIQQICFVSTVAILADVSFEVTLFCRYLCHWPFWVDTVPHPSSQQCDQQRRFAKHTRPFQSACLRHNRNCKFRGSFPLHLYQVYSVGTPQGGAVSALMATDIIFTYMYIYIYIYIYI